MNNSSHTSNYDELLESLRLPEDKVDEEVNPRPDISPIVQIPPPLCDTQTLSVNIPSNPIVSSPLSRGIKRGYRNFTSPQSCGVSTHDDPVWLWSLRPKEWSSICILQDEWERLRLRHPSTWERFRNVFDVVERCTCGGSQQMPPGLYLVD